MARQVNKLTARGVETVKDPGTYEDGDGLRLVVGASGSKSWQLRFQLNGRRREMGLGGYPLTSLAAARGKARDARALLATGVDPLAAKQQARQDGKATTAATVQAQVEDFFAAHGGSWSATWRRGWERKAEKYVYPVIGQQPVAGVAVSDVLQVLRPLWGTKTRTAEEVRWLLERVLGAAKVQGLRTGDNPAAWADGLDQLLDRAARKTVRKKTHHPALPWQDAQAFVAKLHHLSAPAAIALQLLILTAARSGMVRLATWDEFDLEAGLWALPADRMKSGEAFAIPLPAAAVELLRQLPRQAGSPYLFPGQGRSGVAHRNFLRPVLLELGHADITAHGFRSTFRTWAGERTSHPRVICELALAHDVRSLVEGAYDRSDYLTQRRALLEEWAAYLLG